MSAAPPANPYVVTTPVSDRNGIAPAGDYVTRCGKFLEDTTMSIWHHVTASPNLLDATLGRLTLGTKLLTGGGFESIFKQHFDYIPGEKLREAYPCLLSTSIGAIPGTLFVTTQRITFLSDRPVTHRPNANITSPQTRPIQSTSSYYKLILPTNKIRQVNACKNPKRPSDKYIQLLTVDGYDFWFLGFVNFDNALRVLQEVTYEWQRPTYRP